MPSESKDIKTTAMDIHLTEYRALREEQKTRLTIASTMMNFILLIVAADVAAYAQLLIANKANYIYPLMLATPILTTPICMIYYDNVLMVYRMGRYLSDALYPTIKKTSEIKSEIFGWDAFHTRTSGQLFLIALFRNLFFVVITIGPIIIYLVLRLGKSDIYTISTLAGHIHLLRAFAFLHSRIEKWEFVVFSIDLVLLSAIAIAWAHSGLYFKSFNILYILKIIKQVFSKGWRFLSALFAR